MSKNAVKWYKIVDATQLLPWQTNAMCVTAINGKKITLGKHNNQVFAFAHKCPHAGGILSDGHIDALGNIVCPLHRYKFSLQNGRNTSGEGYYLKTFPVQIRPDGVFIGFADNNLFGWLK